MQTVPAKTAYCIGGTGQESIGSISDWTCTTGEFLFFPFDSAIKEYDI